MAVLREEIVIGVVGERLDATVVLGVLLADAGHFDRACGFELEVTCELLDVQHTIDKVFLECQVLLLLKQDALFDLLSLVDQGCIRFAQGEELGIDFLLEELPLLFVDLVVGTDRS